MDTEASHTPFIRIIGEGPQREIAVRISSRNLADGEAFAREYLSDHPMRLEAGYTDEEVELMGAAFLLMAGSLPIFSYDLIRWTDETCMFDGAAAMREYGEKHLCMERAESPAEAARDRMTVRRRRRAAGDFGKEAQLGQAVLDATVQELGNAIFNNLDSDDVTDLATMLVDLIDHHRGFDESEAA